MRVLMLTQILPYPPDSGPKIKTYQVLRFLATRHDITLVSFVRGDQSGDVESLARFCKAVYTVPMPRTIARDGLSMARSLISGNPWMMVRDQRPAMRFLVERLGREQAFDIVHADQLNMAQYASLLPCAKILDEHNALWVLYKRLAETMSPGPKKWLLARDWRLLKEYEGRLCREFDAVLAVTDEDRTSLQEAAGLPVDVCVVPIAIDTDEVTPVERQPGAIHVLHMGTMYWPPNIDGVRWFLREVFPRLREKRQELILDIVGARPPEELLRAGGNGSGVNVLGYVADPLPYLERAGVFIVPLRAGGGMRVKILNALAQGIPVVSTSLGCEGLAVTHGKDILVADSPDEFANCVLRILGDRTLSATLVENGRRLVELRYDYRQACLPLDGVYEKARNHHEAAR